MLTHITPDRSNFAEERQGEKVDVSFAETLKEDELEESEEEGEFDLLHFFDLTFDDSIKSDSSNEDRINTEENQCGGMSADCDKLCAEKIMNDEEGEDITCYLQDCDAVLEELQAQLKSIEDAEAGTELFTMPAIYTDNEVYSQDEVLFSCSEDVVMQNDACAKVCEEITEDEELLTSSSALEEWNKMMQIGDKLISLGQRDPDEEEVLSTVERQLDRQDCPVIVGNYIDPFSSLLRTSTKRFRCVPVTQNKARIMKGNNKSEGLSLPSPLTSVQQWSRFVVPLHASLPLRYDDRKCTQFLLFFDYINSLWIFKDQRELLRFDSASGAIRVHVP